MKLVYLILFLSVIICNEIVFEMLISDDHNVSLIDGSSEEKAETENFELEGESEVEFINDFHLFKSIDNSLIGLSLGGKIYNVKNPYLEIYSPPPDFS